MTYFCNASFLYIDPGTGSMLFSILIGAASMLYFLTKAALLRLKVFFSGRKNGVVHAQHVCRRFRYDPTKRLPPPKVNPDLDLDFKIDPKMSDF